MLESNHRGIHVSVRYETEDGDQGDVGGYASRSTPIDADSIEAAASGARAVRDSERETGRRLGATEHKLGSQPRGQAGRQSNPRFSDSLMGVTRPYQRAYVESGRVTDELDSAPTSSHHAPEPLPPSPEKTGHGWFKPSLKAESVPDLGALTQDSGMRTFERHFGLGDSSPQARSPLLDLQARPWLFSLLLGATCLAVGMVLGALFMGGAPDTSDDNMTIIKCSEPPER
ncbi:MAG: hypothetical protein Tsb0020_47840 [Haliangiales bacterium]